MKSMSKTAQMIALLCIGIVFTFFILYMLYVAINIPTMHVSHSTGECVRVIPTGSCDEPPTKYLEVKVK